MQVLREKDERIRFLEKELGRLQSALNEARSANDSLRVNVTSAEEKISHLSRSIEFLSRHEQKQSQIFEQRINNLTEANQILERERAFLTSRATDVDTLKIENQKLRLFSITS